MAYNFTQAAIAAVNALGTIARIGFGQVELNHVSGIIDGSNYAQLPADATLGTVLENGRFAKYNMAAGKVTLTGDMPWLMIYNETKLYDERYQNQKDYAMEADNFTGGEMTPRLIEINVGDIFTTNTFGANTSNTATVNGEALVLADPVKIGADGYLTKGTATAGEPQFQVVKVYTMADGQPGVKLQRVA